MQGWPFGVAMGRDSQMQRLDLILSLMTPTQRRRWRLRLSGASITQIARVEGVGHPRIVKSLAAGRKRAKKIVGNGGQTGDMID
jgi:hypothetical protein